MSSVFKRLVFETQEGAANKALIVERIAELRTKLEDEHMTDRDTALTRGAIRELRSLIAAPPQQISVPRYDGHDAMKRVKGGY